MKKKAGLALILAGIMMLGGCGGPGNDATTEAPKEMRMSGSKPTEVLEMTDEVYETRDGTALSITRNLLTDTFEAMDGKTILTITVELPQIDNPKSDGQVKKINRMFMDNAEQCVDALQRSVAVMVQKEYEMADLLGEVFEPYTFNSEYTVSCNKNGIFSMRETVNYYIGEEQISSLETSTAFDLERAKALEIEDIFAKTEDEMMAQAEATLKERVQIELGEGADTIGYYIGEKGVYFFYNQLGKSSPEASFMYDRDESSFNPQFLERVK